VRDRQAVPRQLVVPIERRLPVPVTEVAFPAVHLQGGPQSTPQGVDDIKQLPVLVHDRDVEFERGDVGGRQLAC